MGKRPISGALEIISATPTKKPVASQTLTDDMLRNVVRPKTGAPGAWAFAHVWTRPDVRCVLKSNYHENFLGNKFEISNNW